MADNKTVVFIGRRFNVERLSVPGANGKSRPYEIVAHPGAAVILPLLDNGDVVLIRNCRPAVEQELLELPAGTLDDETPLACARRELTEETGYRAERVEPLVSFYSSPGICTERLHAFVATGLQPGPTRHEPDEQIRVTPLPHDEAIRAIADGRIVDAKTIVTLLYSDRFRRGKGASV